MDLIVTTPKSERENAALEAENVKKDGGGWYFRYLGQHRPQNFIRSTSRLYYVLDGYVRGYALIRSIEQGAKLCETTGKQWPPGYYAVMDATTWTWIRPIPMKGFQGWRYFTPPSDKLGRVPVEILGGWLDPMPEVKARRQGQAQVASAAAHAPAPAN